MPKNIHKSIHVYLSKLKRVRTNRTDEQGQSSPSLTNSSTKKWILSGCKHAKTLSFAVEKTPSFSTVTTRSRHDDAATLSDIDRFLFENFNSLYCNENDNFVVDERGKNTMKHKNKKKNEKSLRDSGNNDFMSESPRLYPPPKSIHPSNRFFVSPGTSGSLVEENRSSTGGGSSSTFEDIGSTSSTTRHTTPSDQSLDEVKSDANQHLPDDSVAVLRNSPNPYDDFRRSMQEMIEARLDQNQAVDWDFMEELLFCYLKLNEKRSYKYILGAFVDLIVNLRQNNTGKSPATRSRRVSMKRKEIKKIVRKKDCVT